ncbi:MAG: VWA domain-containing protein [Bradymonadaceae bacterium]|nr:VWA domain-containing protein [Lujinxingiaceae bacterium]
MKHLGPIIVVVVLLLCAAFYYSHQQATHGPEQTPPSDTGAVSTPPIFTHDATPQPEALSAGTLTLKSSLSHGYMAQGARSESFAAIDITAVDTHGGKRLPLNVALVIDRSGSMHGAPMEYARQAAMQFVDQLRDGDRLAIVSFSRDVSVDFPSSPITLARRQEMKNAIARIQDGGATNISDGYIAGFAEVRRWKTAQTIDRVILLTDGIPNVGMTDTRDLVGLASSYQAQGISLTTMGFGLDYNEDLMAAMADAGAGNYYFIANHYVIAGIFEREFQGLDRTVARGATVSIDVAPGVEVEKVYGFPFQQNGSRLHISLAEFAAGQNKNILMKLRTQAAQTGSQPVLDVQLSYDDLLADRAVTQRTAVSAVVTSDARKAETMVNTDVIARVQDVEIASSMNEAMDYYQMGNAARAQEVISKQVESTRGAQKRFALPEARFEKAEKFMNANSQVIEQAPASAPAGRKAVMESKEKSRNIQLDSLESF